MLIAIMANTFDYIIDRKAQFSLENKLKIMSEYYNVIHSEKQGAQDLETYLFIVRPKHAEDELGLQGDDLVEWQGSFSYLRKEIEQKVKHLEAQFEKSSG